MTSTISSNRKKSKIKLWAVAVWLIVWQVVSMRIGQEILLVSPVAVIRRLLELVQTAVFWQSLACSFSADSGRIPAGDDQRRSAGRGRGCIPSDRRAPGALCADGQVDSGGVFYHSCADLGFTGESVSDHLAADGFPGDLYECERRDPQHGQEADGDGGTVCHPDFLPDPVYLCFADTAVLPGRMHPGSRTVLEIRHSRGGDRPSGEHHRRESV